MLYTLFLIFCIIAGFNGMPYLFFFPILTIVGVIVIWIGTGKILESEDNSKTFNNSKPVNNSSKKNDDLEDFIILDTFFNDKK